jgi:hypothetical protein
MGSDATKNLDRPPGERMDRQSDDYPLNFLVRTGIFGAIPSGIIARSRATPCA